MRLVIQRVTEANVEIDAKIHASITNGYMVLLGIENEDTKEDIDWLVRKLVNLRVFSDSDGDMNLSLSQVGGSVLLISQFTLFASTKKGNRPSFLKSAKPDVAIPLYDEFIKTLSESGVEVKTGIFGADMKVSLINEGPVTILIDSKNRE